MLKTFGFNRTRFVCPADHNTSYQSSTTHVLAAQDGHPQIMEPREELDAIDASDEDYITTKSVRRVFEDTLGVEDNMVIKAQMDGIQDRDLRHFLQKKVM